MKLIVLDRDGVINEDSDEYIKSPEEYIPIPGSIESISRLNKAGYTVVVATNQSGIARGLYSLSTLQAIHKKLLVLLEENNAEVDGIHFCPHVDEDNCDCRKPKPGLMHHILGHYPVAPNEVLVIGDSLRDLQMAIASDTVPILVLTGNGQETMKKIQQDPHLKDIAVYPDLATAATHIIDSGSDLASGLASDLEKN